MVNVYAGGIDTDVVEDLVVVHQHDPKEYKWVQFNTGREWLVPTEHENLAGYIDGLYETIDGMDFMDCDEHWDADGRMYYVAMTTIDTEEYGEISLYLTVPE